MDTTATGIDTVQQLPVELIDAPALPTRFQVDDESLHELAQNIRAVGLLQPVVVTPHAGRFRLVAGNRRLRAVKLLGHATILAHIVSLSAPDEGLATIAENLRRQNLHPLEEAAAVAQLAADHNLTHEQLAEMLGTDRTWVTRRMQLVNLPDDLQDAMVTRGLDASTALELARVDKPEDRAYYTGLVVDGGASLKTVRQWMRDYVSNIEGAQVNAPVAPPRMDLPAPPPTRPPACHVCGKAPPDVQLTIAYLCWQCSQALKQEEQSVTPA